MNTRNKLIQATIREGTNLKLLNDKISVLADFNKSFPKKFREIFKSYLENMYTEALTKNKI